MYVRVPTLPRCKQTVTNSSVIINIDEPVCQNVLLIQAFHLLARPSTENKVNYICNSFKAFDEFSRASTFKLYREKRKTRILSLNILLGQNF